MTSEDKTFYLKELNVIAVILVILYHVGYYFPVNVNTSHYIITLSYINVGNIGFALFFMITGALLINREYSVSYFMKKYLITLIMPAAFWIIVSILVYLTYIPYSEYFFTNWILNNRYIWFPLALIGVYLIMPVFNSFVKEYGIRSCEYFLAFWILLLIMIHTGMMSNANVSYILDSIGIYIGFSVLGYYLANKDFNILSGPMIIIAGIIFIVSFALTMHLTNAYAVPMDYMSFVIIADSAALFLIFRYVDRFSHFKASRTISKIHNYAKTSWISNIVNIISICSFGMYFITGILSTYISKHMHITSFNALPTVFIAVFIISLILMIVLSLIPVLNRIVGTN